MADKKTKKEKTKKNQVVEVIEEVETQEESEVKKETKEKVKKPFVFQKIENVDVNEGLSSEEAENRILNHYNNENNVKTTKSAWQIISGNIFTFFNMLYLVITVLLSSLT